MKLESEESLSVQGGVLVHGKCDERFEELARLLAASIDEGEDLGASVAVTIDDETVVDIWGGWADEDRTKPWREDTIINVWSNTKTMVALVALLLVERNELDVYAPVTRYWPEFGANGKERVEIRHLLSHSSGVAGWDPPVSMSDVYDVERSVELLAKQAPWWEPGSASGYHGLAFGHLMGEVVRRITGQTIGRFFASEIAEPMGIDFHIGLDPKHDARVSPLILPPPLPEVPLESMEEGSVAYRLALAGVGNYPGLTYELEWRRSEICAGANGWGNARSVAHVQSLVSHGGSFNGFQLLSPGTLDVIFDEQTRGRDLLLNMPIRWGIGYALSWPVAFPYLPDGRVCFWAGWGGSMVINDLDRRMTFAYMMNKMEGGIVGNTVNGIVGGLRSERLIRAAYGALADHE